MDFFQNRKSIGEHLTNHIRQKGYTKTSLSKMAQISRPTLNQILEGTSPNPNLYNQQLMKITSCLEVPADYFISPHPERPEQWQLATIQYSDRSPGMERSAWSQELLGDLDDLLTVAAFYIKE